MIVGTKRSAEIINGEQLREGNVISGMNTYFYGTDNGRSGIIADTADINPNKAGMNTAISGVNTDCAEMNADSAGMNADLTGIESDSSGIDSDWAEIHPFCPGVSCTQSEWNFRKHCTPLPLRGTSTEGEEISGRN